jgi:hypothetical protein
VRKTANGRELFREWTRIEAEQDRKKPMADRSAFAEETERYQID